MVLTVAHQKTLFSRRQIAAADTARELYRKLGRPSEAEFYLHLDKEPDPQLPSDPG
jgi:hypothetical protein